MLQRFLTLVSESPVIWNVLRWIAEAGYRRHYVEIDRALHPWRPGGRRFLNLGCGTGQFAACFPADRYLGIDPQRAYIDYAVRRRDGTFTVMDGSRLALTPASFDGALV